MCDSTQPADANYYVYVCDIDKPWDIYLICHNTDNISWLEWDTSGTKLILATGAGKIQIWVMKVYINSSFKHIYLQLLVKIF